MPIQQLYSYIKTRTSSFSMRWWWGLLCIRPTRGYICFPTRTQYPDSGHFLLYTACLAEERPSPILKSLAWAYRPRTHDLPHSRRARYLLNHGGVVSVIKVIHNWLLSLFENEVCIINMIRIDVYLIIKKVFDYESIVNSFRKVHFYVHATWIYLIFSNRVFVLNKFCNALK